MYYRFNLPNQKMLFPKKSGPTVLKPDNHMTVGPDIRLVAASEDAQGWYLLFRKPAGRLSARDINLTASGESVGFKASRIVASLIEMPL